MIQGRSVVAPGVQNRRAELLLPRDDSMVRRLSRYLLITASSLVAAVIVLPAGCIFGSSNCTVGEHGCADDQTLLVCHGGEGEFHFESRPCGVEQHCRASLPGTGECVGAREGEACLTIAGCADSPFCLDGTCSPVPAAAVSVCTAGAVLDVPAMQEAPDGVTVASSFEPGKAIVVPLLDLDPSQPKLEPCGKVMTGPERVFTIKLPVPADNSPDLNLVVTIEGVDPAVVPAVAGTLLGSCGDRRTLSTNGCFTPPDGAIIEIPLRNTNGSVFALVLQSALPLTNSAPFSVHAKIASLSAK